MLEPIEKIKSTLEAALPGIEIAILSNEACAVQPSLLLDRDHLFQAAWYLRETPEFQFDYASNVTGVDWPESITKQKIKVKKTVEGAEKEVEETIETKRPGYLEVIYHLYSMALKHGPLILRARTGNRFDDARLPSLTPIWRGAEFQEREIFDLYGVIFEGHPDLRRILMWDGFKDFPMRKDYIEPDDYEYEPTPHDEVLARAKCHWPASE